MAIGVPQDLDCTSWAAVEPHYRELLARPLASHAAFWAWLDDFAALTRVVHEFIELGLIAHTRHTEDAVVGERFRYITGSLEPQMAPLHADLQKKGLGAARQLGLDADPQIAQTLRRWQADVDLFRDANTPLFVEATQLAAEYDARCGAMTVEFDGATRTIDQLAVYLSDARRDTREQAWRAMVERRLQDRDAFDDLFDRLVAVRHQTAVNAGHPDYRSYTWLAKKRFDYSPEMCAEFGRTVEALVVPLVDEWNEARARALGLPALRPWDLRAAPASSAPLRPFAGHDADALVDGTERMLRRVSPVLAEQFAVLRTLDSFDLVSRTGKQPGGYQAWLPQSHRPFIFMNAAGVQRDIEVLLHEAGHAFHALESDAHVPILFAQGPPSEMAEVASMSMELLASDSYDEFYSAADARRAKRHTIETAIRLLPRVAKIDAFQQWLYTNPVHTRRERTEVWRAMQTRFGGASVDWTGLDDALDAEWQWILHLFAYPFYFIEYGFAQLGALQVWQQFQQEPDEALARYRRALALGGSRPLPQLWAEAGLTFEFSRATVARLVEMVRRAVQDVPL